MTQIRLYSVELAALSVRIASTLPPDLGFLAEQLRQAAAGVQLNLDEAQTRTPRAQRRFFRVARDSARELAALLDMAARFGMIGSEHAAAGRDATEKLTRALARLS